MFPLVCTVLYVCVGVCVCGGVEGGALLNVIALSVLATLGHYDITPEDKSGVKLTNEPVYLRTRTHTQVAAQSRTSVT